MQTSTGCRPFRRQTPHGSRPLWRQNTPGCRPPYWMQTSQGYRPILRQTPCRPPLDPHLLDADPPRQIPLVMWPVMHAGKATPIPCGQKEWHACENITLPQTSFAGDNKCTYNYTASNLHSMLLDAYRFLRLIQTEYNQGYKRKSI